MRAFVKLKNQFIFPASIVNAARTGTLIKQPQGWSLIDASDNGPVYKSPCGEFILKRGMFTTQRTPALSVPTKFLGRSVKARRRSRYDGTNWRLQWTLQPFATPTTDAAYHVLYERYYIKNTFDSHEGNMGVWRGHPVLFDW